MNGNIISIENYDVLMDPPINGKYGQYQLDKYQDHVGNKRLEVFLNLHRQSYQEARQRNSTLELDSIVEKITSLPGRFLWNANSSNNFNSNDSNSSSNNGAFSMRQQQQQQLQGSFITPPPASAVVPMWQSLPLDQVRAFVHAILQQQQQQPQQQQQHPHQQSHHQQQQSFLSRQIFNGASLSPIAQSSSRGLSPNRASPHQNNNDDTQKRRRRSSLLRRSASEGMLVDSKKKLFRMRMDGASDSHRRLVKEEPTWSSSRNTNQHGLILTLNRMDVILTSSRNALDPNSQSAGNNRLHVLVAMKSGKYQQANIDGREAVLDEVIETVKIWNGRFLAESEEGYELIDKEDVRHALRSIFDMRSSQNLFSRRDNADMPMVVPDKNLVPDPSSHAPGMFPLSGPGLIARSPRIGLLKQSSTGMIQQPLTMVARHANAALARQVSTSVLPAEPIYMEDVGNLRSAAVRGLQKQKERQKVASRLEKGSSSVRNQNNMGVVGPPTFMDLDSAAETSNHHTSNHNNNMNGSAPLTSFAFAAKKRQSTFFGALDPSLMEELNDIDDADSRDD
jgi:hypothetical protein